MAHDFDSRGQTKFRDGVKHNNGFFQLHVIRVTQLSSLERIFKGQQPDARPFHSF
jgi:hypothetical protein